MSSYAPPRNGNLRYIFHCVDYFSGKSFARAIPNRENTNHPEGNGATLANAFMDIVAIDAGGIYPRSIICDQEFNRGSMRQLLNGQVPPVVIRQTTSYTPESNVKIERFNRTLRKVMRAYFVRTNDIRWANHLQDFVDNINNQQQSGSNFTANQLWTPGYQRRPPGYVVPGPFQVTDQMTQPQWHEAAERYHLTRAERLVTPAAFNNHVYHVGDLVRVKFMKLNNRMRKHIRMGLGGIMSPFAGQYLLVQFGPWFLLQT